MKIKKLLLGAVFLLGVGLIGLQAQESVNATGGNASGIGGSASYTIGQTVYTSQAGTNGNTLAQGVQQAYEISVVTALEIAKDINLSFSAYPNPTTNCLIVQVDNYETANLQYQVYDISGKLLQIIKATGRETQINTSQLIPSNYFVKVIDNSKEIRVFKIIITN